MCVFCVFLLFLCVCVFNIVNFCFVYFVVVSSSFSNCFRYINFLYFFVGDSIVVCFSVVIVFFCVLNFVSVIVSVFVSDVLFGCFFVSARSVARFSSTRSFSIVAYVFLIVFLIVMMCDVVVFFGGFDFVCFVIFGFVVCCFLFWCVFMVVVGVMEF